MTDPLSRDEAPIELAQQWRDRATALEDPDPRDRAAKAMRKCAEQLQEVTSEHAVKWVSHAQVKIRTGRSDSYLYGRYREMEAEGLARRRGRHWEVRRDAAMRNPVRKNHDP